MTLIVGDQEGVVLFRVILSLSLQFLDPFQGCPLHLGCKHFIGIPLVSNTVSQLLLKQVIQQELQPYSITNIDTTIILQRPKLREHIDAIRENLTKVMHISIDQISVKAKTAEGMLNEVGAGDAIIAEATVLLTV